MWVYPVFIVGSVIPSRPSFSVDSGFSLNIKCKRCDGGIGRWAGEFPATVVGIGLSSSTMPHRTVSVISFLFFPGRV